MASSMDFTQLWSSIISPKTSSDDLAKELLLLFLLDFVGEVSNGHTGAFSLLGHVFVLVILADAEVLSEGLSFFDLDEGDLVAGSKSLDQLDVVSLVAVLGEDHILGLDLLILVLQGLADFVESFGEEGISITGLDDSLEGGIVVGDNNNFSGHDLWQIINIIFNPIIFNKLTNDKYIQISIFLFSLLINIFFLLSMELAKTNLLAVSLIDNALGNNFATIERHMNKIRADISSLFRTSTSIVEKLNEMDPFDQIAMPIPQLSDPTETPFQTTEPISNIDFKNGQSQGSIGDQVKPLIKMTKKDGDSDQPEGRPHKRQAQSRESQQSFFKKEGAGKPNSNSSLALLKQLQEKIEFLTKKQKDQAEKISNLGEDSFRMKKILGLKTQEPKPKQKKQEKKSQKSQRAENQQNQQNGQNKTEKSISEQSEVGEQNLMSQVLKEFNELKEYSRSKFILVEQELNRQYQNCSQIKQTVQKIQNGVTELEIRVEATEQKQQNLKKISQRIQAMPTANLDKTTISLHSRKDNSLNETVQSYKSYYEEKIVQIFQNMDKNRQEYLNLLEKMKEEGGLDADTSMDREKIISLAKRIGGNSQGPSQSQEKLKKQLHSLKRDHKRFRQEFSELVGGINVGTNEKRTLVIKPNENKEDWKDLSHKIFKTRHEILSMVKELQGKIVSSNDVTVLVHEIEIALEECKIMTNRKVNIEDYNKGLKRLENRINTFIQHQYEKEGAVEEQDSMLVKQPWFCLSCDSEIKNFPKQSKTFHAEKQPTGKKVNRESHMVRRPENGRLPSVY